MQKALLLGAVFAAGVVGMVADAQERVPGVVTYEEFGAVGDGKADDQSAIVAAHAAANEKGLPVKAGDGKTYYIGGGAAVAVVKTDVDFGTAKCRPTACSSRSTTRFGATSATDATRTTASRSGRCSSWAATAQSTRARRSCGTLT